MQKVVTVTRTVMATQHLLFFHATPVTQANGATKKVPLKKLFAPIAKLESILLRQQRLQSMHVSIATKVNS